MVKKILVTFLAALCVAGAGVVSTADAASEYFYNGYLGNYSAVSGVPRGSLYFVGAYTGSTNNFYCVEVQNWANSLEKRKCVVYETSNVESFPSQFGRGYLVNEGGGVAHFLAEERW
jgi:hypothetical protein